MQVLEQIESVDREKLKQQNHIHEDTECSEEINSFTSTTIYGHVNQHMEKNISNTLREIYDVEWAASELLVKYFSNNPSPNHA
ncbi:MULTISPECIES: hypothetical protein [unclassified Wolbachia]|uniref:hypothetical protein n=1 Tax=unclassified Wolbachia TaxID=2640676 RepID=UPI002231B4E6|nr:hypothetical protein [Wolbachia endosymbiont (group A) of Apoderus coryli]